MDRPRLLLYVLLHLLFLNLFIFLSRSCYHVILHHVFLYRFLLFIHVHDDQLRQLYLTQILDDFYLLYQNLGLNMCHHVYALAGAFLILFRSSIPIKLIFRRDRTKLGCNILNNCNNQIYIWHTTVLSMTKDHLILIIYLLLRT